jgi:hypothetical protein
MLAKAKRISVKKESKITVKESGQYGGKPSKNKTINLKKLYYQMTLSKSRLYSMTKS